MGNFLSYELLPIILNMTLTASVVILFVPLYRLALRKAPRVFSYALWLVVLFRLLCPISVTGDISLLNLLDAPVTEVTAHTSVAAYVPCCRWWIRPWKPSPTTPARCLTCPGTWFTIPHPRWNCRFPGWARPS